MTSAKVVTKKRGVRKRKSGKRGLEKDMEKKNPMKEEAKRAKKQATPADKDYRSKKIRNQLKKGGKRLKKRISKNEDIRDETSWEVKDLEFWGNERKEGKGRGLQGAALEGGGRRKAASP